MPGASFEARAYVKKRALAFETFLLRTKNRATWPHTCRNRAPRPLLQGRATQIRDRQIAPADRVRDSVECCDWRRRDILRRMDFYRPRPSRYHESKWVEQIVY